MASIAITSHPNISYKEMTSRQRSARAAVEYLVSRLSAMTAAAERRYLRFGRTLPRIRNCRAAAGAKSADVRIARYFKPESNQTSCTGLLRARTDDGWSFQ